jgi:MoaA/NifB/PqqE/SkfB family radical SAM enzyme
MSLNQKIKLFADFAVHKKLRIHSPLVALLLLTSRCNLQCKYCFAEHSGEFEDLPLEKWKYIIDELEKAGTKLIFLMGGEPLLYKDFPEIISYVKSKGMMVHLTTNGLLIPKYIEELKKVDLLMVSLDGNEVGHNANRGCFQQVIEGIETAKNAGIKVRVNAVMTKNTKDDIAWLLNFGEKIGVYIGFTIPTKGKNYDAINDMLLGDEEKRQVHRELLAHSKAGKKITLSDNSLEYVLNYPLPYSDILFKDNPLSKKYDECMYGRYLVFIDASGSVYPCTPLWEQKEIFTPKNIFADGFKEAIIHAQKLNCQTCVCAGGQEWGYITSIKGIVHALKFAGVD